MATWRRCRSRARRLGIWFLVAGSVGWGAVTAAGAADKAPAPGRFGVTADGEPLGDVLKKLGAKGGYEIRVAPEWADDPVTVQVEASALEPALRKVLAGYNYYTVSDDAQRVIRVRVLGRVGEGGPSPGGARTLPSRPPPAAAERDQPTVTIVGGRGSDEEPAADGAEEVQTQGEGKPQEEPASPETQPADADGEPPPKE